MPAPLRPPRWATRVPSVRHRLRPAETDKKISSNRRAAWGLYSGREAQSFNRRGAGGTTGEQVLAAVARSRNVVLVRPAAEADRGDGIEAAAAALRRAAGISAPYVLVAADPLAAVADEWREMWDLSRPGPRQRPVRAARGRALAAWRSGQFELPDYYLVLAEEAAAGPRRSAPGRQPDPYPARSGPSGRTGWRWPPRPSPPSRRRRSAASSARCGPAAGGRLSKKCSERSVASTRAPSPSPPTRGVRPCWPDAGRRAGRASSGRRP